MKTIIKYCLLPFKFDTAAMLDEVAILQDKWLMHYNTQDYSGEWKAIPLRSSNGSAENALASFDINTVYADTPLLALCPTIKSVIDSLKCEKTVVRILNLRPGAIVKAHTDAGLAFEQGEVRIHIPLKTNDGVDFYVDDEALHLREGECWYINFELKHSLANNGNTDRIHLVIDCIVNPWLQNVISDNESGIIKRISVPDMFSIDQRKRIIDELKRQGTEVAFQLASKMESELDN